MGFSEVLERQLDAATVVGKEDGINFLQPSLQVVDEQQNGIRKVAIGGLQEESDEDDKVHFSLEKILLKRQRVLAQNVAQIKFLDYYK